MRWVFIGFLGLYILIYVFALGVFLIGEYGLFGQPIDPLAGILIVPLGLPWIQLTDPHTNGLGPVQAAICPLINIGILYFVYRIIWPKRHSG